MATPMTEYHRNYYYVRRQKLIDHLGGACTICGATTDLHFDHIDPAEKSFDISRNVTLSNEAVRAELAKCQILCRTHHEEKTARENTGITHGTPTGWMRSRCKCDECSAARRAWNEARNAERRAQSGGRGRGAYGRPAEHGEILSYRRGCKCTECRSANASYARSLRDR